MVRGCNVYASFNFCLLDLATRDVPTITAFEQGGLKVVFSLEKVPDSNTLTINVSAVNNTLSNMSDFLFQAAVPKVILTGNKAVFVFIRYMRF